MATLLYGTVLKVEEEASAAISCASHRAERGWGSPPRPCALVWDKEGDRGAGEGERGTLRRGRATVRRENEWIWGLGFRPSFGLGCASNWSRLR